MLELVFYYHIILFILNAIVLDAAFAGVLKAAQFDLAPIYCLAWGVVQTFSIVFISFTRLLFTL